MSDFFSLKFICLRYLDTALTKLIVNEYFNWSSQGPDVKL